MIARRRCVDVSDRNRVREAIFVTEEHVKMAALLSCQRVDDPSALVYDSFGYLDADCRIQGQSAAGIGSGRGRYGERHQTARVLFLQGNAGSRKE